MVLNKIFGNKNSHNNLSNIFSFHASLAPPTTSGPIERKSPRALKIVHVGGHSERYYMAIPASTIIEKYPSFILARPEIFKRPWDSIVRPNEILVPGQKYYVVPRQTVRKLRRRVIKKDNSLSLDVENALKEKDSLSISGILVKPGLMKIKARNLHVRFFGIETSTNDQKQGGLVI